MSLTRSLFTRSEVARHQAFFVLLVSFVVFAKRKGSDHAEQAGYWAAIGFLFAFFCA